MKNLPKLIILIALITAGILALPNHAYAEDYWKDYEQLGFNQAPIFNPIGDKRIDAGRELVFQVEAYDLDGDELSYFVIKPHENLNQDISWPDGAEFAPSTRTFRWTPGQEDIGKSYKIYFAVSDSKGGHNYEGTTITVTDPDPNINDKPYAIPIGDDLGRATEGLTAILPNQTMEFAIKAYDPEGEPLSINIYPELNGAFIELIGSNTWRFSWAPTSDQVGCHEINIKVIDPQGLWSSQTIPLTVISPTPRYFYVSPDGNDLDPGTLDQPWQGIYKAAEAAVAGDIIYLREGTYILSEKLWFSRSGTKDYPIVVKNYPGETARIDGSSISDAGDHLIALRGDRIVIDGLDISNGRGYQLFVLGNYNIIRNCKIHNPRGGITDLIKMRHVGNIIIENCELYNTIRAGDQPFDTVEGQGGIIRNNIIHDTYDAFIIKGQASNFYVYNNLIYDRLPGGRISAIYLGGSSSLKFRYFPYAGYSIFVFNNIIYNWSDTAITFMNSKDCAAFNNIVVSASGDLTQPIIQARSNDNGDCLNNTFANNIIYANNQNYYTLEVWQNNEQGFVSKNNIWYRSNSSYPLVEFAGTAYQTLEEFQNATGQGQGSIEADPLFVNLANNDFHLMQNSPAINSGTGIITAAVSALSLDFDGKARDSLPDIGAYEYVGPAPTLSGDVNGDGKVDLTDLVIVSQAFGTVEGQAGYDQRADLNGDKKVTLADLTGVAGHFGEKIQ